MANRRLEKRSCVKARLRSLTLVGALAAAAGLAAAQSPHLLYSIVMPEVPPGPYADHMAIDLQGLRLFTTPQANHAVDVLDLRSRKLLHTITGFGNPHSIFFDRAANRLFVTDGGAGALRVFDATTYDQIKSIRLRLGADGLAYDGHTGLLYVSDGGEDAGKPYSFISIIDVAKAEKLADIRVDAPALEAMAIDTERHRLYVDLPSESAIEVIDLLTRKAVARWTLKGGRANMALALDATHHLLYVGCRDTSVRGSILVVDENTGKALKRLPIGGWVDALFLDSQHQLIYASCGVGELYTYKVTAGNSYKEMPPVDTAVMAKTSLYAPTLDRIFVAVPHLGDTSAKVLVFQTE